MKLLTPFFIIIFLLTLTVPALAQTPTVSLLQRNARAYDAKTNTNASQQQRILSEIDRRITVLTNSLTRLTEVDFLSETEKNTISQKIQNEINTLTQLKSEIQSETDATVIKEKAKLLLASHRIFAFFFPQIRILSAADNLNKTANMLFDYAEKLEARIAEAKTAGENTAALESSLANMKAQITSAQTITTSIMSAVTSTTSDSATHKTVLQTTAKQIKQAANNLRLAFQTGNKIRVELSQMTQTQEGTMTGSSSATPQL